MGEPIGWGSSRLVYRLSDSLVLKLAYGGTSQSDGVRQNENEYKVFSDANSPLLARIFAHDPKFRFLVCENVMPARDVDFEYFFGIPFKAWYVQDSKKEPNYYGGGDKEVGFNKYFDDLKPKGTCSPLTVGTISAYLETNYITGEEMYDPEIERFIKGNKWLSEIERLVRDYGVCDIFKVENFGVVNRDGKPMMVILDYGYDSSLHIDKYKDTR